MDGKEDYKVVMVNNLPVANVKHEQLGGITSSGEFGSMLYQIFAPQTQTQFEWERWATLRGQADVRVQFPRGAAEFGLQHSRTSLRAAPSIAGYHGLVYADAETKQIMRIKMDCDGLEAFPDQPGFADSGLRAHQDLGPGFRPADGGRGAVARGPDARQRT